MENKNLSSELKKGLEEHKKGEVKRRLISYSLIGFFIVVFGALIKIYAFPSDMEIASNKSESPEDKIIGEVLGSENEKNNTVRIPIETEEKETTTTTTTKATTTTTTKKPEPKDISYTLKKGDTLSTIANANGMSTQALIDYNGMSNPDSLMPGDVIKIPN